MDYKTKESIIDYVLKNYTEYISLLDYARLASTITDDYTKAMFRRELCERIMEKHKDSVFMNYCPVCGRLARTPRALQCPSGHRWSDPGTPGTSA